MGSCGCSLYLFLKESLQDELADALEVGGRVWSRMTRLGFWVEHLKKMELLVTEISELDLTQKR